MDSREMANKIRLHVVKMAHYSKESHVASALSIADIVAVLYSDVLNISSSDWNNSDRDRFILSKGHACAAVYAALAEGGFFEQDELYLQCQNGARLSGHICHMNIKGVEASTGSLGHGCCIAAGMALAGRCRNAQYKVYTLLGDGECNEGSVWEMAQFAAQQNLNNFRIIIDYNRMQAMGDCKNILDNSDMAERWKTFGWNVIEIDGHDHSEIKRALLFKTENSKPICIIAHTVKGKGVSFMENNLIWHYRDPQGNDYKEAIEELENTYEKSIH